MSSYCGFSEYECWKKLYGNITNFKDVYMTAVGYVAVDLRLKTTRAQPKEKPKAGAQ